MTSLFNRENLDKAVHRLCISLLVIAEAILCGLIIWKIPYTEIDWRAYMQEVEGFLSGERNYMHLEGDTGPLVYPAGFVYVFVALRSLTDEGLNIFKGQIIFAVIDVAVTLAALLLYRRGGAVHWIFWPLLLLSKRVHSIFVLRLFNDCIAVLFGYVAFNMFINKKWRIGCLLYSLAVSIKMNMLLYAPGILLVLLLGCGLVETILCLSICAGVQLVLAYPFLSTYPVEYLQRSFDLGRVFMHKWTVNYKFVPEDIFASKPFSLILLGLTVVGVIVFAIKWVSSVQKELKQSKDSLWSVIGGAGRTLNDDFVITVLFTSNFIGIAFARSLHYQFYCWYFHTIFYLCTKAGFHWVLRLAISAGIEVAFNVFPATPESSMLLQGCHVIMLLGLLLGNLPSAFVSTQKKKEA